MVKKHGWEYSGWDFSEEESSRRKLDRWEFSGVSFPEGGIFLIPYLLLKSKQRK